MSAGTRWAKLPLCTNPMPKAPAASSWDRAWERHPLLAFAARLGQPLPIMVSAFCDDRNKRDSIQSCNRQAGAWQQERIGYWLSTALVPLFCLSPARPGRTEVPLGRPAATDTSHQSVSWRWSEAAPGNRCCTSVIVEAPKLASI